MELKLKIGYKEILELIKQLPASQLEKIRLDINARLVKQQSAAEIISFQEFLVSGPVMNDQEYEAYLENRKHFSSWRAS